MSFRFPRNLQWLPVGRSLSVPFPSPPPGHGSPLSHCLQADTGLWGLASLLPTPTGLFSVHPWARATALAPDRDTLPPVAGVFPFCSPLLSLQSSFVFLSLELLEDAFLLHESHASLLVHLFTQPTLSVLTLCQASHCFLFLGRCWFPFKYVIDKIVSSLSEEAHSSCSF